MQKHYARYAMGQAEVQQRVLSWIGKPVLLPPTPSALSAPPEPPFRTTAARRCFAHAATLRPLIHLSADEVQQVSEQLTGALRGILDRLPLQLLPQQHRSKPRPIHSGQPQQRRSKSGERVGLLRSALVGTNAGTNRRWGRRNMIVTCNLRCVGS
jgi:hypothetical protein